MKVTKRNLGGVGNLVGREALLGMTGIQMLTLSKLSLHSLRGGSSRFKALMSSWTYLVQCPKFPPAWQTPQPLTSGDPSSTSCPLRCGAAAQSSDLPGSESCSAAPSPRGFSESHDWLTSEFMAEGHISLGG